MSSHVTMSRKRQHAPAETTPASKRHLNAALAAELQTLRISRNAASAQYPAKHVFGASVANSPFLSAGSSRFRVSSDGAENGMRFGTEFEKSLTDMSKEGDFGEVRKGVPVVVSPSSSSSSLLEGMAVEEDGVHQDGVDRMDMVEHEGEKGMGDIVVEDLEAPADAENRLVVYRPPVRTGANSMARVNACLPEGKYVFRNARTDEWVIREAQNERTKRKLALVPWRGDVKKICDPAHRQSRVICMPWKEEMPTVVELNEEDMEIEDIS